MTNTKTLANIEAEESVLGCIFASPKALAEVQSFLHSADFYRAEHRVLFDAMKDLQADGKPIDLVTVSEHLSKAGTLDKVGGLPFLTKIANSQPSAANVRSYVEIVKDYSRRRAVIDTANVAISMASDNDDINSVIAQTQIALATAMADDTAARLHSMRESMLEYSDLMDKRAQGKADGIATGYKELDRLLGGLDKGTVTVLAARPSMGKSALAGNIAYNVAKAGKHVLYFSMEMNRNQMIDRLLSFTSGVPAYDIKHPQGKGTAIFNRLYPAMEKLAALPLEIDDRGHLSLEEIASKATMMKAATGLDLIIIDHLQIMRASKQYRGSDTTSALTEITGALKAFAMRINIPVIVLSQLNRDTEHNNDKRPTLAMLRGSGSIEQDADIVLGLYRNAYYDGNEIDGQETEVIILKARDGQRGTAKLYFYPRNVAFTEYRKK